MLQEIEVMGKCNHPNIIRMFEHDLDANIINPDATMIPVSYSVLELGTGELFDFVALTGKFDEKVARFYFRQLIDGLNHAHKKGVTHRDLKPENLQLDVKFNLKIADFGFAAPIEGRDGGGLLKTSLGSLGYKAPEIEENRPYKGAEVDLFASAVILFIMVTGHPPFKRAVTNDPYYRLLAPYFFNIFWTAHSRGKPADFFNNEFKDLITKMLQYNPTTRLSMAEVYAHPWFNGPKLNIL